MTAYYNENDPFAAAWLRELIRGGHIAPGEVDDRSIHDVQADDLRGFTQHHFFAGVGVWSHALRLGGWPDDRPVWTGSCPCQPFSVAGKRGGAADARHLWPVWLELIRQCQPATILGEQVAGKAGYGWWDIVSTGLEGEGYACAAADLAAASVGAPHIRQRLYWLANAANGGRERGRGCVARDGRAAARVESERLRDVGGLGHAKNHYGRLPDGPDGRGVPQPVGTGQACGVGVSASGGREGQRHQPAHGLALQAGADADRAGPTNGYWRTADWLGCTDGKWRPVEPGSFPLASGITGRVGRLRGYGNAICAPLAAAFVEGVMECV